MTKRELNRDVKRLRKQFNQWEESGGHDIRDMKKEWTRLWMADSSFEYFTAQSMRDMLKLWSSLRPVQAHVLFLSIK